MIDVADLPQAVQHAVATIPTELTARDGAAWLRQRAANSYSAVAAIWATCQWHQVLEQLTLVSGYLTAACRLEEEAST